MKPRIYYREGYKYQLAEDYTVMVDIHPERVIITDFTTLYPNGGLTVKEGYAWDGPSGPTIDTANFMRGSLVHDALYQLMREGHLDIGHRKVADQLLHEMCLEDGMSSVRAWWVYRGVRFGGANYADPTYGHNPVLGAP